MPRTRVQRVGQESASLQALELLCSSDKGLIGRRVMSTGEANDFRDYKRLGAFAKLATSYWDGRTYFWRGWREAQTSRAAPPQPRALAPRQRRWAFTPQNRAHELRRDWNAL